MITRSVVTLIIYVHVYHITCELPLEPLRDVGKLSHVWSCRVNLLPGWTSRVQDQIMTLSAGLVPVVTAIWERRGGSSSWLSGRMWVDAGLGFISSLCSEALTGWINMEADDIISCYSCCVPLRWKTEPGSLRYKKIKIIIIFLNLFQVDALLTYIRLFTKVNAPFSGEKD